VTAFIGAPAGPHVGQCQNFSPGDRNGRGARYCLNPVLALGGDLPADRDICQACRQRSQAFGERFIASHVEGLIEADAAEEWMSTTRALVTDSWAWYYRRAAEQAPMAELHKIRQDIALRERLLTAVETAVAGTVQSGRSVGLKHQLTAPQWRVVSYLYHPDQLAKRVSPSLAEVLHKQHADRDAVVDLVERGLVQARVGGEECTRGPLKRLPEKAIRLRLTKAGIYLASHDAMHLVMCAVRPPNSFSLAALMHRLARPVSFDELCDLADRNLMFVSLRDNDIEVPIRDVRECPELAYATQTATGRTFIAYL
jgi:hypothetical protein